MKPIEKWNALDFWLYKAGSFVRRCRIGVEDLPMKIKGMYYSARSSIHLIPYSREQKEQGWIDNQKFPKIS
jgi:hypothetical protein